MSKENDNIKKEDTPNEIDEHTQEALNEILKQMWIKKAIEASYGKDNTPKLNGTLFNKSSNISLSSKPIENTISSIKSEETNNISKIVSEMFTTANTVYANLDLLNFAYEHECSRTNYQMLFDITQRIMNSTSSLQMGCNNLIEEIVKVLYKKGDK